jgi:DNA invertase Pin-like site-specific DNA recombinase
MDGNKSTTTRAGITPQQATEARRRRADGATLKELADSYNISKATISRLTS